MPSEQQKNQPGSQGGSHGTFSEHASKAVTEAKEAGVALASQAGESASAAMTAVKEKASDLASGVVDRVDSGIHAAGRGMENLAQGIRDNTPNEGFMGTASGKVADTLESSGKYLEQHGVGDMVDDLTEIIRRNPIPAVLVGIGVGFVLAKATSR
jgi:hypothetical protein